MEREERPAVVINNKSSADKCPECGSTNIIHDYDTGETVCGDCGFVLGQELDKGPERRAFTAEARTKITRTGPPIRPTIADNLATQIKVGPDASKKLIKGSTFRKMQRLSAIQRRVTQKEVGKKLEIALAEIQKIADRLSIIADSSLREEVAAVFRKARKTRFTKGRETSHVVAASFYYTFRQRGIPRTIEEIAIASGVKKEHIAHCYISMATVFEKQMPVNAPKNHISKIAEAIGISGKTQGIAITILQEAKKKRIPGGRDPTGLAAAALYIACRQNNEKIIKHGYPWPVTERKLAETTGMTETAIRNRKRELIKKLNLEVP